MIRFNRLNGNDIKKAILRAANTSTTIFRFRHSSKDNKIHFVDMKSKRPDKDTFEKYIVVCKMHRAEFLQYCMSFNGTGEAMSNVITYDDFMDMDFLKTDSRRKLFWAFYLPEQILLYHNILSSLKDDTELVIKLLEMIYNMYSEKAMTRSNYMTPNNQILVCLKKIYRLTGYKSTLIV